MPRSGRVTLVLLLATLACAADAQDWILSWEAFERQAGHPDQVDTVAMVVDGAAAAGIRGRALVALAGHAPKRAVAPIVDFAASSEAVLRLAAAEAAASLRDADTRAALGTLVKDPDADVALMAALALARREGESSWRHVRDQLASYDPQRALLQGRILATVGSEGSAARWDQFLEQAGQQRHDLIRGLAWASGPRWRVRMQDALVDDHTHRAAGAAILALPEAEYAALIDESLGAASDRYHRRATELVFERPIALGRDHLVRLLESGTLERSAIALALDILRADLGTSHPSLVTRYLADEEREIRRRAVRLAAGVDDDQAVFELLKPAMSDPQIEVLREAVSVIAQTTEGVPAGGIVGYVEPALAHEKDAFIREALKLVQWRLDESETDRAIVALRPLLFHEDRHVREDAREALERAGGWRVAQTLGFVGRWQLIGPFENDADNAGFATAHPPEGGVDLSASYPVGERHAATRIQKLEWRAVETTAGGHLLLHNQLPPPVEYNVAYAYAEFSVDAGTVAKLVVEGDDSVAVWLNGESVLRVGAERTVDQETRDKSSQDRRKWWDGKRREHEDWWPPSEGQVEVRLEAGRNRLLVKTANLDIYWWFRLRLVDLEDKPVEVQW